VAAAHGADLDGLIQCHERAADEGVLGLDQIARVKVEWTDELLGRLDGGRQLALATNRIENGIKWIQTVAPRDEHRVARSGQHGQVGVQGTRVRLEVSFLLLLAFADQLAEDLSSILSAWSVRVAARSGRYGPRRQ